MRKMMVLTAVACLCSVLTAQTVKNEMDIGNNNIEWRVYEAKGPVNALALTSSSIWYSSGTFVGTCDRKTLQLRAYPKLGDVSSEGIKSIAVDNNGGVWLGGAEGVVFVKGESFTRFTTENGLADNIINVVRYAGGAVWVGTDKGACVYNGSSWKVYTAKEGIGGNKVRGIASDDGVTVYLATNKGVAMFRGGQWKVFNTTNGLSSNDVKAIEYDKRKSELWIATGEMDVNSYNGKEWSTFLDIQAGIICIMADSQSRIWFGSQSGAFKYNGFEWITDPAKIGFPAALISDMVCDSNGDMYFALESGIMHMKNPYPY